MIMRDSAWAQQGCCARKLIPVCGPKHKKSAGASALLPWRSSLSRNMHVAARAPAAGAPARLHRFADSALACCRQVSRCPTIRSAAAAAAAEYKAFSLGWEWGCQGELRLTCVQMPAGPSDMSVRERECHDRATACMRISDNAFDWQPPTLACCSRPSMKGCAARGTDKTSWCCMPSTATT
jgi:hypothetical protein